MPKPFIRLSVPQFRKLLKEFPFSRRVSAIHLHHSHRPSHAQFRGIASIEALHDFHKREHGLTDIAQHVAIDPDGAIWTGRNWDKPPASVNGHNGNAVCGPFMIVVIGDFDSGHDRLSGAQRQTTLQAIAAIQERFELQPEALLFHSQLSASTCPGSSIDRGELVGAVRALHQPRGKSRDADDAPFAAKYRDDQLNAGEDREVRDAIDIMTADITVAEGNAGGDFPEPGTEVVFTGTGAMTSAAARGTEVTAGDLVALRKHVINLNAGLLTEGGIYYTLPADVDRIFGEDLEQALRDPATAGMPPRHANAPFRIMIWAHGGMISEKSGLAIARKHLNFWKGNGVYPIYFAWETGLFEILGQLLRGVAPAEVGTRNFISDKLTDPLIEELARLGGGEKIWGGMKRNAEVAATPAGGATKVATELVRFEGRHRGEVEIHCAGHSAGSIFHAGFLPVAFDAGLPEVAGLHLLAPAIRIDTFKGQLAKLVGQRIRRLSMFTMVKELEEDDQCAGIYRKSLLYLIHHSLERERKAAILGLETSLRGDAELARLFGLGGQASQVADVVFSSSLSDDGPFACRSTTHGGFDDDPATMNSIALRLLGLPTRSTLAVPYPQAGQRAAARDPWVAPEIGELQRSFASAVSAVHKPSPTPAQAPSAPWVPTASPPVSTASPPVSTASPPVSAASHAMPTETAGKRRALCVGIDNYDAKPLAGCVADAQLWERTLASLGFQCTMLLDRDATHGTIAAQLDRLIDSARPGDSLVWTFAGHGTMVPDVNGDEADGDSPGSDEAICPVDMHQGRFFVDDHIAERIQRLPQGVSFTMLMDCCHSGSLNRFGMGEPARAGAGNERSRFLPLTAQLRDAYLGFARSSGSRGASPRSRSTEAMLQTNEVLFTACQSSELAWESNGNGAFTLRATQLLSRRGGAMTNQEFHDAVLQSFGSTRRQTPTFTCADRLRNCNLFQAIEPVTRELFQVH